MAAQKLLFGSSTHGDLLQFLNGHFDLDVGFKQDECSYVNILRNLGIEGKDAVFFTDIVKGEFFEIFFGFGLGFLGGSENIRHSKSV